MRTVESFYEELAAGRGGLVARPLRGVLWVASLGYRGLIAVRNARYDRDPPKARRVDACVISVGNITTGGTGKTPMVIDVVTRLADMGCKAVVVSRGYKSGRGRRSDELTLIERAAPVTACVANADRVAGAEEAIAAYGAEVIVLDDGFQHRRLARDLDMVLIDATVPFGFGHLLPRGLLREPAANLARADLVVITRADQITPSELDALKRRIEAFAGGIPTLAAVHKPQPLLPLGADSTDAATPVEGPAYLVSGIGNHAAFRRTVESANVAVCGHARFPDHHRFGEADARAVCAKAVRRGAACLIVTEKDAVKLERLRVDWCLPVQVLSVRIDFWEEGGKIMDEILSKVVRGAGADGGSRLQAGRP